MTTGGLVLSPVETEALGKLLCDQGDPFPRILGVEDLPSLHDRKGVEQKLVHAGSKRLHANERSFFSGDQPIEVSSDTGVVLQTGNGGHIEDLTQSRPTPMGHALLPADALPGVAPGGIRAGQLDELATVPILINRTDMGEDTGGRGPGDAGDAEKIASFFKGREPFLDLLSQLVDLVSEQVRSLNQTGKLSRPTAGTTVRSAHS